MEKTHRPVGTNFKLGLRIKHGIPNSQRSEGRIRHEK